MEITLPRQSHGSATSGASLIRKSPGGGVQKLPFPHETAVGHVHQTGAVLTKSGFGPEWAQAPVITNLLAGVGQRFQGIPPCKPGIETTCLQEVNCLPMTRG